MIKNVPAEFQSLFSAFRLKKGDTVFYESDPADAVFFLEEGLVKLVKAVGDHPPATLGVVGPGRPFGMMAVLDRKPYPVTAVALESGRAARLATSDFLSLMSRFPAFATGIYADIGIHVRDAQSLRTLMQEPISTRLARVLCLLNDAVGPNIRLFREEIAALAGMTVGSVVRELADLKEAGIVKTGWKRISIIDAAALRAR